MMTDTTRREDISALQDGELEQACMREILANLDDPEFRQAWYAYHLLGDVVRSEDLAVPLSADFSQRFAERFASEPILLPVAATQVKPQTNYLRSYISVASIAAAGLFAYLFIPSQFKDESRLLISQASAPVSPVSQVSSPTGYAGQVALQTESAEPQQVEMLRDARLDSYLLAHQRFSPSIANVNQHVTHANLVSDAPGK